jgi:hypothetical protein
VKVLTGRCKGGMTEIVADKTQIYLLIGHVGSRAMSKPVG